MMHTIKKNVGKVLLACLLAAALPLSIMPLSAMAAEGPQEVSSIPEDMSKDPAQIEPNEGSPSEVLQKEDQTLSPQADSIAEVTDETGFKNALSSATVTKIVLLNDITLVNKYTISKDVEITSQESTTHTLYWGSSTSNQTMLTLSSGKTLTISHITLNGNGKYVKLIQVNGGTLIMNDGATLKNLQSNSSSNAVSIGSSASRGLGGTFIMNGGSIEGVMLDAAVSCVDGTMTMSGNAAIQNNTAYGVGLIGGTLNMCGNAAIKNNSAARVGAGVLSSGGTINMGLAEGDAPTIANNTSTSGYGGGLYLASNSVLTMKYDSSIQGNTAATFGGAIAMGDSTVLMEGNALIACNTAPQSGCGLFASGASTVTMNDTSTIEDNVSTTALGGGVYLQSGASFDMQGSSVVTRNTGKIGGGVRMGTNTTVNIGSEEESGPTISGNTATERGGGIYVSEQSTLNMHHKSIVADNGAEIEASGIYQAGALNLSHSPQISDGLFITDATTVPTIMTSLDASASIQLESSPYLTQEDLPLMVAQKDSAISALEAADGTTFLAPLNFLPSYRTYLNDTADKVMLGLTYSVTYNGLASSDSANNPSYFPAGIGIPTLNPPIPNTGFIGWFDAEEGGTLITSIPADTNEDVVLWAHFFVSPEPQELVHRSLTDQETGIIISGNMSDDVTLIIEHPTLHAEGCPVCDEIRADKDDERVLALHNLSLSGTYQGDLTISFPVDEAYSGQTVTILHCDNGKRESTDVTVTDGMATGTFKTLSPFAVVKSASQTPANPDPDPSLSTGSSVAASAKAKASAGGSATAKTGDFTPLIPVAALMIASLLALIMLRKKVKR